MTPTGTARSLRMIVLAACVVMTALASPAAARQDTPEAFLRHVYGPYLSGDQQTSPTGKDAPDIFDAHLTELMRQDQSRANGEVGALDQDPVCDCQDFDHLTALSIAVRLNGRGRATAAVRFRNGATTTALKYTLIATGSGWRVADIGSKDMPSLAAFLDHANAPH